MTAEHRLRPVISQYASSGHKYGRLQRGACALIDISSGLTRAIYPEGAGAVQTKLPQARHIHDYPLESRRLGAVHMAQDESGPHRKLSRLWHGPYRIVSISDPDVLLTKVYFPQDRTIQVHQSRMKACPPKFPAAFYWYGGRRRGPGRPPRWVSRVLDTHTPADPGEADTTSREPETTADSGEDSEDSADQASDSASDRRQHPHQWIRTI